jgi:murein DD-endopeptidase MepM/ murein hydrolase activator NlpD
MLREQLGAAMAEQMRSPFERQLEQGIQSQMPKVSAPVKQEVHEDEHDRVDENILPVSGRISSPMGWRRDPINGQLRYHRGTDIAATYGSDVKAVADGVVVESGVRGGYGNTVVIETEDGRKMLYAHNSANHVQVGDRIRQGDVIAQVGATGRATGPHVHFEVMEP